MSATSNQIALETLSALENRIQRVGWYLSGSDVVEDALQQVTAHAKDQTLQARLARLEADLSELASKSQVIRDLLKLHSTYPDLFQPTITDVPATLATAELLAVITSCATAYPTTASRLNAIKDLPIPPAESSASLIALHPRLAKVEMLQDSQALEMAELRTRTASAIQRWYELGVLGESECWAEWEGRVVSVEKRVRREEIRQDQIAKESQTYHS